MQILDPHPVPGQAAWRWSRQALQLLARRPAAAVLGGLVCLILFSLLLRVEQPVARLALALLAPPLSLAGFIRLAAAADRSEALTPAAWLPTNRETWRLLLIGLLGYGAVLGLAWAALAGQPAEPMPPTAGLLMQQGPLGWAARAAAFGAAVLGFGALLLGMRCWFLLPLTQFSRLGLRAAVLLALRGYQLNHRTLELSSVLSLAAAGLVVILTVGIASLIAPAFLGALLYVSFREVYLGQPENAPQAQATAACAQPA